MSEPFVKHQTLNYSEWQNLIGRMTPLGGKCVRIEDGGRYVSGEFRPGADRPEWVSGGPGPDPDRSAWSIWQLPDGRWTTYDEHICAFHVAWDPFNLVPDPFWLLTIRVLYESGGDA